MLRGFFQNKCPYIKIVLQGTTHEEVDVLVDTGFNGHISIAQPIADKLGLIPTGGISTSKLADGSTSPSIIYLGKVIYNNRRIDLDIDVDHAGKSLVGMNMLEEWGLNLFVDLLANKVELRESPAYGPWR